MTKVLVLYHSMYGHIETMANAVAEGARGVAGVEVTVKRVPETMSAEILKMPVVKWIKLQKWRHQQSWLITMPLSLVHQRASAT